MYARDFYLGWDWYRKGEKDQLEDEKNKEEREKYLVGERLNERKSEITKDLGILSGKIIVVEHHFCHAAAAYFASPWAKSSEKVLVLTSDGSGDGVCATVSIGQNGELEKIADTKSSASLGKIYSRITYLMGMKPWEHEYKIMGLAPYADEKGVEKSYKVLSGLIEIDDGSLSFKNKTTLGMNYCYPYLREKLENHRFDWIAGAIQKLHEELIIKWVKNVLKETGLRKIAAGGGSFMNVKANMKMAELESVDEVFIFPSCGDESVSIGAAYFVQNLKGGAIQPISDNYFGGQFSEEEIKNTIETPDLKEKYIISKEQDINKKVASLLAEGEIVARFSGRMEWGARALGNRSILMDPRNKDGVRILNMAIKQRDFWMPFAPTVLDERQNDYLINKKNIRSPYMIMAFETTEKGRHDLSAGIHPYDFTARPQILQKEFNPDYYSLIKEFEKITGVGAVLNTSFNLHGEPVVHSPEDAISVFERSGLKHLALGKYLISKKP
jgi:carbamoyltransferase